MQTTTDISPDNGHEDEELLRALAALPDRPPPADLSERFRQRLVVTPPWRRGIPSLLITGIAAMLVIASSAAWWHERQLRLDESKQLHSKLNIALQSLSLATRLQAITAAVTEGRHGDAVEQALVTALLTDQSTNVRMAAAEALGRIARPDALGQAVRRALAQENSPFVQMTLLETTNRLAPSERRSAIAPILTREHIDPMVVNDARGRILEPAMSDSR